MDPISLHAWLMATAWLALLPAGTLVARFFKVARRQDWPRELDNQAWWRAHRALQYGGVALATLAFALMVWTLGGLRLDTAHAKLGMAVLTLGWLQVLSAWLRGSKGGPTDKRSDPRRPQTWRGDHYDMTPRRRAFEAWHKSAGYAALALAVPTVALGLPLIGLSPWWSAGPPLLFAVLFAVFRRQKRWFDTWEAIWGPRDAAPAPERASPLREAD